MFFQKTVDIPATKIGTTTPTTGELCDKLIQQNPYDHNGDYFWVYTTSSNQTIIRIGLSDETVSTLELFYSWIDEYKPKIYYPLATPTYTKITDTTLIAQLEAYYNSSTYRNVTNIITAGEDLPPIASIVYKKDLTTLFNKLDSLEARVDLLEE